MIVSLLNVKVVKMLGFFVRWTFKGETFNGRPFDTYITLVVQEFEMTKRYFVAQYFYRRYCYNFEVLL